MPRTNIVKHAQRAEPVVIPLPGYAVHVTDEQIHGPLAVAHIKLVRIIETARAAVKSARGQTRRDLLHIIDIAEGRE